MAAQQTRIVETILKLKRARTRNYDRDDAQSPVRHLSNRGNKLKLHAEYVQEGRLWNGDGPSIQAQNINHAGYERSIIYRKPPRYDEDGDLVFEDDFDDEEADFSPAEDDIYADVKLEDTLGPLTAASSLATHPGMAPAYTSKALDEMIGKVSKNLRREQENLAKMKSLLTILRGDEQWAPCGDFQTDYDEALLQGQWLGSLDRTQSDLAALTSDARDWTAGSAAPTLTDGNGSLTADLDKDIAMVNGNNVHASKEPDIATITSTLPSEGDGVAVQDAAVEKAALTNGHNADDATRQSDGPSTDNLVDDRSTVEDEEARDDDSTSAPISHRMTTRARANKQSEEPSSSADEEAIQTAHPIFLFPPPVQADADFGLPSIEAEALRNYVSAHVARQEEIVRSIIELQSGLLEANRLRKNVWKWAKAEGHVGELSDGEDWVDLEEWGLKEPLKKGEEEPDEEANNPAKKTRQRRTER